MEAYSTPDAGLQRSALREMRNQLAEFDVFAVDDEEIEEVQAFAARLIGPDIAGVETLRRVHQATRVGLFTAREKGEITGVVAFVPLTVEGLEATRTDVFKSRDPEPNHVAAWGSDPAGLYGWGVAAANGKAARRLVASYQAMIRFAVPHLPVFARAATVLGERLLVRRLQYRPFPGSETGLLWIEPYSEREFVAA